jgi:hypothetical protein
MTVDLAHGRAQFVSGEFKNSNTYTYEVKLRSEALQCKDFQIVIKVREFSFFCLKSHFSVRFVFEISRVYYRTFLQTVIMRMTTLNLKNSALEFFKHLFVCYLIFVSFLLSEPG